MLTGGELAVSRDLRIDGDGNDGGTGVTISGGDASRILNIAGMSDVGLEDLVLTDGQSEAASPGGAILLGDGGGLTLNGCEVRDSNPEFYGRGGGIYAGSGSRLAINDSILTGNRSGEGGGIFAEGDVELILRDSRIVGNGAYISGGGGLDINDGSRLTMEDCVVSGNDSVSEVSDGGGIQSYRSDT